MLGILCTGQLLAVALSRTMKSCTREVEGPFFGWRGILHGDDCLLLLAEEGGAEAAYAAARLLARRGAKRILYLGEATAAPYAVRVESWELGALALPSKVYDGRGLTEITRVLPDSARSLPLPVTEAMIRPAGTSIKERANSPGIATLSSGLRNPWFADYLYENHKIALTDLHASGAADAAHEEDIPCVFILSVTSTVRRCCDPIVPPLLRERVLLDALTDFAVSAATGSTKVI